MNQAEPEPVRLVCITLCGRAMHLRGDCTGLDDGQAEARRLGYRNHPKEWWPVHLARAGHGDIQPRDRCQVCYRFTLPIVEWDDPLEVRRALSGEVAELTRQIAENQRARRSARDPIEHGVQRADQVGLDDRPIPITEESAYDDIGEGEVDAREIRQTFVELMLPDDVEDLRPGGHRE